ncbi:hypothetical protein B0H34DRAFT_69181 [Crassisporium funariophilum]|nr:hypothetical protein B0H34DRAFT_69181 [Crassisporium funariophilum]
MLGIFGFAGTLCVVIFVIPATLPNCCIADNHGLDYLSYGQPVTSTLPSEDNLHVSAFEPRSQAVLSIPDLEPHHFIPEHEYTFLYDQQSNTIPVPNAAAPVREYSTFLQNDAFGLNDLNGPSTDLDMISVDSSGATESNGQRTPDVRAATIDPSVLSNVRQEVQSRHICKACSRCFTRGHDLNRHITFTRCRSQREKPDSDCGYCGETFCRPDAVFRHQRDACPKVARAKVARTMKKPKSGKKHKIRRTRSTLSQHSLLI